MHISMLQLRSEHFLATFYPQQDFVSKRTAQRAKRHAMANELLTFAERSTPVRLSRANQWRYGAEGCPLLSYMPPRSTPLLWLLSLCRGNPDMLSVAVSLVPLLPAREPACHRVPICLTERLAGAWGRGGVEAGGTAGRGGVGGAVRGVRLLAIQSEGGEVRGLGMWGVVQAEPERGRRGGQLLAIAEMGGVWGWGIVGVDAGRCLGILCDTFLGVPKLGREQDSMTALMPGNLCMASARRWPSCSRLKQLLARMVADELYGSSQIAPCNTQGWGHVCIAGGADQQGGWGV